MRRVTRLVPLTVALCAASTVLAFRPAPPSALADGVWRVVAWNDLGMHCMDSDYSVFSILPPFNNVQAQVVKPDGTLAGASGGIQLSYQAVPDPEGSANATSQGKTNYWQYTALLYGGVNEPDTGLAGFDMPGPSNIPQPMAWDAARKLWFADGVPITPLDSQFRTRNYPLMRVVARSASGAFLASADVVLPVSSEMDCRACHASGSGPDAMPAAGWVYDASSERDYRRNILRLHDQNELGTQLFDQALVSVGYQPAGLLATADSGQPILCASCHRSNALPGTGLPGIPQLTSSIHDLHATAVDPETGLTLDDSALRSACYLCHPGSETRCLRGAMGSAVAPDGELSMQCQNCHSDMSAVGDPAREGWLEQPNCQACHTGTAVNNNGEIRYHDAFEPDGSLRIAVDNTFATDANVPAPGFSLYRFSAGHGDLTCEACHGSTHAEYPGLHGNDNLQMQALQGHAGTLSECTTCHAEQPETDTGGPHGMHPLGDFWVDHHTDAGQQNPFACRACHGVNWEGTELSRMFKTRTLKTKWGPKTWFQGATVSCWGCHDGPFDDDQVNNAPAVVQNASAVVGDLAVPLQLVANDPNGDPLTLRIVKQPSFGRVGLVGSTATYHPDPGFAGDDTFTFAAWDGEVESNLGTVTITRLASWSNSGTGYPGTGGSVPDLTASAGPSTGSQITLQLGNSLGSATPSLLAISPEYASFDAGFGATLWILPTNFIGLTVPAGGAALPYSVPNSPALIGKVLRLQAVLLDPGATFGLAFTPALVLVHGL